MSDKKFNTAIDELIQLAMNTKLTDKDITQLKERLSKAEKKFEQEAIDIKFDYEG